MKLGVILKLRKNESFCNKCNCGEIEDEVHFLINCNKFHNDGTILFDFIGNEVQNFNHLDNEQKFMYLLISENPKILNAVGKFISNNL